MRDEARVLDVGAGVVGGGGGYHAAPSAITVTFALHPLRCGPRRPHPHRRRAIRSSAFRRRP